MLRPQAFFITGTDTEVGKTFAACALLHAARKKGLKALGMKPVAAGVSPDGRNEDVEQLIAASSFAAPRELVNPYCFESPVAPHIAATIEGCRINPERIMAAALDLAAMADLLLIEGVGGFRVPLDDGFDTADLAVRLDLPVVLVVGLRLGCLNHALLTAEAIQARGLTLAGWIANDIDPCMHNRMENLATLEDLLHSPLLGHIPRLGSPDPSQVADNLQLSKLLL
jgi:dethiobiotin synthetase